MEDLLWSNSDTAELCASSVLELHEFSWDYLLPRK